MTFLSPAALWFGLVGAAIVALYLLKVKRKRETVPSLEFWRQLLLESQVRSLFQRLKRWLSLLLWLAIAACVVLALGNPVITSGSIRPETLVIVLDNSASMQAVEKDSGGQTRFELGRDAIERLSERRPRAAPQVAIALAAVRTRRAALGDCDGAAVHRVAAGRETGRRFRRSRCGG